MALNFANNNSLSAITTLPASISGGGMTLISEQTASSSASISFSLDDSYDKYEFKFINLHPQTDFVDFTFNLSTDNGSNYNVTKTSTFFNAYHSENDSFTGLNYNTSFDLAQSTNFQSIFNDVGNGADESVSGYLQLFNPSSDTFVKHYIVNTQGMYAENYSVNSYTAGYGNTQSPITNIKFQMDSGNIDSGVIKLYGIS